MGGSSETLSEFAEISGFSGLVYERKPASEEISLYDDGTNTCHGQRKEFCSGGNG